MSIWTGLALPVFLAFVELGARIYRYRRFGLPFKSRVFAEYPYHRFVEKADPPFHFRLKKGYRSPSVNINRHGMRGPELSSRPGVKRALFLGESHLFGVKLFHERDLWSFRLKRLLDEEAESNWEIMNFSFPGYNTHQYRAFFEHELVGLKPDFLVLSIGANDITQARMFGEKWYPGMTYPFDFIFALARKSHWWEKILNRSCFYFLWRRKSKEAQRSAAFKTRAGFKKDECFHSAFTNMECIARGAQACGIKVVFMPVFPAYELLMSSEDQRKITSIQSNWRQYVDGDGPPLFEFFERMKSELSPRLNMPVIDLRPRFWRHLDRFTLYFDLYHLNPKGMRLLAEYLYEEIEAINFWK
ncbi:MAG: SGNH/GDSL hydrolase family protein [Desulfobacteraceae bacterium]|nr:MAG: SGNH/GDSL hydrolase family protein [Desulfobacteraceae bacterium]